jgi:hypothetical protein
MPAQGQKPWAQGAACQWPITNANYTDSNLFYVHWTCPWYNYGTQSQSCDSVVAAWQGVTNCKELLESRYIGTWWLISKK